MAFGAEGVFFTALGLLQFDNMFTELHQFLQKGLLNFHTYYEIEYRVVYYIHSRLRNQIQIFK